MCVHLKNIQKCTKCVKRNAKRNFFPTIIKMDGSYSTSQEEVAMEFVHFYSDLLGQNNFGQSFNAEILKRGPTLLQT